MSKTPTTDPVEKLMPTLYRPMTPDQVARFQRKTYTHSVTESYGYTRHFSDGSSIYISIGD